MESIHLPTEFLRPKRGAKDRALQLSPRRVLVRALKMHIHREMDVYRGGDDTTAVQWLTQGKLRETRALQMRAAMLNFTACYVLRAEDDAGIPNVRVLCAFLDQLTRPPVLRP